MIFTKTSADLINLDLLRRIIETAALGDRRTALKLAVLSKTTRAWVEPVIYSEVNLCRESSGRAFLYTIQTSKTKPPTFFARHVKSLVVCSDVEAWLVVDILSVCRGLVNLSYWPSRSGVRQQSSPCGPRKVAAAAATATPQRMSVLLHETHIYPLKPHFNLLFFSCVTHLSILNSWQEWTTWTHIYSNAMPALTHIKFDLQVQVLNLDIRNKATTDDIKLSMVANTLSNVLNHNRTLRVCILVLRFDTHPTYTTNIISSRLASRRKTLLSDRPVFDKEAPSQRVADENFDPRLVFVHEREPFRYSHAHSKHETLLWKSAENIVDSQQHVTGYTLLDGGSDGY